MEGSPTAAVIGLDGPLSRRRVIVRGGDKLRGDVVMFDLPKTDAATTNMTPGEKTSGFVNVVSPITAQLKHGLFGVVIDDTGDDQHGYVAIEGFTNASLIKASGDIAPGDLLVVDTNGTLTPDGVLGDKAVAYFAPLDGQAMTAPTTRTLGRVYFSGINPIGAHGG